MKKQKFKLQKDIEFVNDLKKMMNDCCKDTNPRSIQLARELFSDKATWYLKLASNGNNSINDKKSS
jgi:hypothetical protein